jgi:glycosyltransferase involved in cell wall biosynthesis
MERVEGNGFLYHEGDHLDLAAVLQKMLDPEIRQQMGLRGIEKIKEKFSWELIATERLKDYRFFGK